MSAMPAAWGKGNIMGTEIMLDCAPSLVAATWEHHLSPVNAGLVSIQNGNSQMAHDMPAALQSPARPLHCR